MRKICLLLSALLLSGYSFAQSFSNAGMETWRSSTSGSTPLVNIHAPTDWYAFDSIIIADEENLLPLLMAGYHPSDLHAQVYQETAVANVNSGSSSSKIITLVQDTIGRVPGLMSNARVGVNVFALISGGSVSSATTLFGGTAVSLRITSVSAYVKYLPGIDSVTGLFGGADTALLNVQALGHRHGRDTIVGTAALKIPPYASFTQVTANLIYWDTTYVIDTVRVVFASSGGAAISCDSSTLYVDDVSMTGVPNPDYSGVNNVLSNNIVSVYPNPANGNLYVNGPVNEMLNYSLFSMNGRLMTEQAVNGNGLIDISCLAEGQYFYVVHDANGSMVQRGNVAVIR